MSDSCLNSVECCKPDPFSTQPEPTVYWNTRQCATAECAEGVEGDPVTVCKEANTYSSYVSVADANAHALADATAEANAALHCGIVGQLSGLLWSMPCTNAAQPCSCSNPADQDITLQGDPGTTYTVLLRLRGVVEQNTYSGGAVVAGTSSHCYLGGSSASGTANFYSLIISDVSATYWLNHGTVPGSLMAIDYQISVQIKGGATVTLRANASDGLEVKNTVLTVGGSPAILVSQPYVGQFIQMDVVSVT